MESLQNGCLDAVGCRFGLYRGEKEADRGAQPLLQARINRLCELVCAAMKALMQLFSKIESSSKWVIEFQ